MPIEGLTPHHNKIYDYLREGGFTTPDKLQDADKIALGTKLPKGTVANLLMDLEKKGWTKRVARGKAAGYYVTRAPEATQTLTKGEGDFSAEDIF
ncbi:MAG: BlaI/MecI/CopY family transcriptional regulator [Thermoplasmatota archaeon]